MVYDIILIESNWFMSIVCNVEWFMTCAAGFLENGLSVSDNKKLAIHYIKSADFKFDVVSILPLDFFYLIPSDRPLNPAYRLNRLLRFRRLTEFFDRTIRRTR